MKKIKSILIAVFLSLVCLFAVACGKAQTGVYKTKSVTSGEVTVSVGETMPGATEPMNADFFVLELKEDNVVVLTITDGDTVTTEGTWTQTGKNITFTFVEEGETVLIEGVQNGKEITVDFLGEFIVVVEKQ